MLNRYPARRPIGFSLIELMITVTIIAILASIAYPSYMNYVIRANRAEAQQIMLDLANREEEYLLNNREYKALTNQSDPWLTQTSDRLKSLYTFTINVDSPPSYTITATAKSGTVQLQDGNLELTNLGEKKPAGKW